MISNDSIPRFQGHTMNNSEMAKVTAMVTIEYVIIIIIYVYEYV